MSQPTKGLLFIPDISGFTRFVNNTELEHSAHIISELLEIILARNTIGLELIEVEGDALFLFRPGEQLKIEDLLEQCESMYLAFHKHLLKYELQRVCQCGACSTASGLQLKFIAHQGEVIERKVLDHKKLMGPDVIIVHRLLKNEVDSNEYVLITKAQNEAASKKFDWVHFNDHSSSYEEIGAIDYQYTNMNTLQEKVPSLVLDQSAIERDPLRVSLTNRINVSIYAAHDLLTNLARRKEWAVGIKDIKYEDPLNRAGATHECILPGRVLHFETKATEQPVKGFAYEEQVKGQGIAPNISTLFTLIPIGENETELTINIHFKANFFQKLILSGPIRKNFEKTIKDFKRVAEAG